MASAAKAAKQRRKEIAKKSKEAAKRRKQMLKESQLSEKAKNKKNSKKEQQANGIRVAIAKAFPTFASALKVKPADVSTDVQSRPKKEFVGRTPSVNLLPPEFTEDRQVASTRRSFFIAGTGVVGALSIVYFAQGAVTNIADNALFVAETQSVETQARTADFAAVTSIYDSLGTRNDILNNIDANAPAYFAALTELYDLLPSQSEITNVNLRHIGLVINPQAEDESSQRIALACGDPVNPFAQDLRPVSACLTFEGTTTTIDNVFVIMETYQNAQLLSNVVVENQGQTNNGGLVRFSGTAAILAEADVSKVLSGSIDDELVGTPSFGGDGSTEGDTGGDTGGLEFEPGNYTINDVGELINTNSQEVIASGEEFAIPADSVEYVIVGNSYYQLDAAGQAELQALLDAIDQFPPDQGGQDELIDPVDADDPSVNGYVIEESTGNIIDPFTGEIIAQSGEWQERNNVFIITATGQPLEMADIYYESFE
jgi:hypothetical protein